MFYFCSRDYYSFLYPLLSRWKLDKQQEKEQKRQAALANGTATIKRRRRSSVASTSSDGINSRASSDHNHHLHNNNAKKRIKLSTPTHMDNDTSIHSFSSALSTTSSSGVSTMSKQSSDTLSVSSAGLGESTDEEKSLLLMDTTNRVGSGKRTRTSMLPTMPELKMATPLVGEKKKDKLASSSLSLSSSLLAQNKESKESAEERFSKILKAIPGDIAEMKKVKRAELCRSCTRGAGAAKGSLKRCSGSCGGLYHVSCLDAVAVSFARMENGNQNNNKKGSLPGPGTLKKLKRKLDNRLKAVKEQKRLSLAAALHDEGVELDDEDDEEEDWDEDYIDDDLGEPTIFPHVTGETQGIVMPKEVVQTTFKCRACRTGELPTCFICHVKGSSSSEGGGGGELNAHQEMTLCSIANCGRAYHNACFDKWPQAKRRKGSAVCPSHQCHLCISDDPRSQNFKYSRQKLYKCILCPTAYHLEQNCMPAGTEIVGHLAIICQRHFPMPEKILEKLGSKGAKRDAKVEEDGNNNSNISVVGSNNSIGNKMGSADQEVPTTKTISSMVAIDNAAAKIETPIKAPPKKTKNYAPVALNVNWCFICASGGSLLCCEQCPSAFHAECLKLSEEELRKRTAETFICEECELGRFPLYGELVWAKFGSYRWWPAVIMSEGQVPANLHPARRSRGEFCIKFLGSNDHAWIGRKRVFLYTDDDALLAVDKEGSRTPSPKKKKNLKQKVGKGGKKSPMKELTQLSSGKSKSNNGMDAAFRSSLLEARVLNQMLQERKSMRRKELSKLMRPVPYDKLKTNRPVAPVRVFELKANAQNDISDDICQCKAIEESGREDLVGCGPSSECLNRLLMTECNPAYCPAGARCDNQRLQKRQYPDLDILRTESRGWGLVAKRDLKEAELVVEYVGELINNEEMRRRIAQKEAAKDDVYYFLTLTKDLIIDAERKGNMARFMNHSCDPNCESEKWTVNGNTRVGIFARQDIKAVSGVVAIVGQG